MSAMQRIMTVVWRLPALLLTPVLAGACAESNGSQGPFHDAWTVMPTSEISPMRGWTIKRGIVHSHSPYSHDACDDEPFVDGVRNEECFHDCRRGMCETLQDFVFLTDHDDLFAQYEYPEVLLYAEGDQVIERDGRPVANRVVCADGHKVIVAAGTETAMMPIGLEHHVGETLEEREEAYGQVSPEAVRALQEAGALVFLQHTEGWELETILTLPIDGIENFNLHFLLLDNVGAVIEMLALLISEPERLPEMELALIAIFKENEADLFRWSKAVEQKPMPAVLATDVHQNAFPGTSPDGERLDSFRRLMHWFSNYLLVQSDQPDDADLKEAIGAGRMYGAFDYLGYPLGFDFHARVGDELYEMGERVPAGQSAELNLSIPDIYRLDPKGPQPTFRARILRSNDGEWSEVEADDSDLTTTVGAGVYRAEVHMVPEHLRPWLGPEADKYIKELVWIYSNPIYVGMEY
jgi:hypothetical protein